MSRVSAETYFELPCKKEVKFLKSYKHTLFSDKCISKLWLQSSLIACMFLCLFNWLFFTSFNYGWPPLNWTKHVMNTRLFLATSSKGHHPVQEGDHISCVPSGLGCHSWGQISTLGSLCLCKLFGTPTSFCSPERYSPFLGGAHKSCSNSCGPYQLSRGLWSSLH